MTLSLDSLPLERTQVPPQQLMELHQLAIANQAQIQEQLTASSSPREWLSLYTLQFLKDERAHVLLSDPEEMWVFTVTRAREACALRLSQDERVPEEVQKRLSPQPTSGGINSSYFLVAPSIAELLTEAGFSSYTPEITSVYKPRHQGIGAADSPIRFSCKEAPSLIGTETPYGISLRHRKTGEEVLTLLCDRDSLPKTLDYGGHTYRRTTQARDFIDPGTETQAEALFFSIAQYLDQRARLQQLPIPSHLGVPRTTIERFEHPLFGPSHTVGSRQDFISDASRFSPWKDGKPHHTVKDREVFKIGFLDLLATNVDRHRGNLLYRKGQIFHVDAGYSLPSFKSAVAMNIMKVEMAWAKLPQAGRILPKEWERLAAALDPEDLVGHLRADLDWYHDRFPEEEFLLTPGQELVLHGTVWLLRLATKHQLSLWRICLFMKGSKVRTAPEKVDDVPEQVFHDQGYPLVVGGELWSALMMAYLLAGVPFDPEKPIPQMVKARIPKVIGKLITRKDVLVHVSHTMIEARRTSTPMAFLQRVFDGEFDNFPE